MEERLRRAEAGEHAAPQQIAAGTTNSQSFTEHINFWMPRIAHIRGWNPYGSPPDSKLSEEQAKAFETQINAAPNSTWTDRTRWVTPFVQDHCISIELLLIEDSHEVNKFADHINIVIKRADIKVNQKDIRATGRNITEEKRALATVVHPTNEYVLCQRVRRRDREQKYDAKLGLQRCNNRYMDMEPTRRSTRRTATFAGHERQQ